MSINQLILDQHKPWCDIRVNSLQTDSSLGQKFTGTITWGSAVANSNRGYTAYKNGNQVILSLERLEAPVISNANIEGIPDQSFIENLMPTGLTKKVKSNCIVFQDSVDTLGEITLDNTGVTSELIVRAGYNLIADGLKVDGTIEEFYNDLKEPDNSSISFRQFLDNGTTIGWSQNINIVYFLDQ